MNLDTLLPRMLTTSGEPISLGMLQEALARMGLAIVPLAVDSKGRALACVHCGKALAPADGWEVCSEACADAYGACSLPK